MKFIVFLYIFLGHSCEKKTVVLEKESSILSPNGNEVFIIGNTYTISWNDTKSNSVRIILYKSDKRVLIIENSTENDGEYKWTPAEDLEVGNNYFIKINSNNDDFIYSKSDEPFTLIEKPSEFSEFEDARDGQVYKTVKIGEQWWMAQNLNYQQESGTSCYNNSNENCIEYGSLYSIEMAKNSAPLGWHLPSDNEWKTLETYLGVAIEDLNSESYRGKNIGLLLKENGGLNFDAKYSGYYIPRYNSFRELYGVTYFWTSTPVVGNSKYHWGRGLSSGEHGISRLKMYNTYYALSVRYIKNVE